MKARSFIAITWFLASAACIGCQAEVVDESEAEAEVDTDAEVGEAEEELAFNCVGQCVDWYRACVRWGGSYSECAAEREACKEECYANTCEPGDPDCCQGQPTCW